MPNVLTAISSVNSARLLAKNSLEIKTKDNQVGQDPISGVLLFYVRLPKDVVQAPNTVWELEAKDAYENKTHVSHLIGDWMQR